MSELTNSRLCRVGTRKAFFHRWIETRSGTELGFNEEPRVFALVEYEDGTVEWVQPDNIVFCTPAVSLFSSAKIPAKEIEYDFMLKE